MSAHSDFEVRELDKSLAVDGEWIEIWRLTGTQLIPIKVRCRASVRNYDAKELIGGLTQDQSEVIISPTQIIRSGWPGPETRPIAQAPTQLDRRVPKLGDKAVIQGKQRNVQISKPKYVDDGLVKITMVVAG